MPNYKSAKKRVKVIEKKTLRNKVLKSALKTNLKKFKVEITENKSSDELNAAYKSLDKAVAKGIMHKNTAANKKSNLAKAFNANA